MKRRRASTPISIAEERSHVDGWGRKVARLPNRGVLLFATDIHGNRRDYERMKTFYFEEEAAGNAPFLLFCGDLVHGPSPDMAGPDGWPDYLGTEYADESREIVADYIAFSRTAQTLSVIGNHEHAHVGGPALGKFYVDEAAELERVMGDALTACARRFFSAFPLLAISACGAVFCHASPCATEPDLAAFEALTYGGFESASRMRMTSLGTVGALLWARMASPDEARALLKAVSCDDDPSELKSFCAFGHDRVWAGYERIGDEQICLSSSYGVLDENKYYLRLDLAERYASVRALRKGRELRRLW